MTYIFYNYPSFLLYLDFSNFQSYNVNEVEKKFSYLFKQYGLYINDKKFLGLIQKTKE